MDDHDNPQQQLYIEVIVEVKSISFGSKFSGQCFLIIKSLDQLYKSAPFIIWPNHEVILNEVFKFEMNDNIKFSIGQIKIWKPENIEFHLIQNESINQQISGNYELAKWEMNAAKINTINKKVEMKKAARLKSGSHAMLNVVMIKKEKIGIKKQVTHLNMKYLMLNQNDHLDQHHDRQHMTLTDIIKKHCDNLEHNIFVPEKIHVVPVLSRKMIELLSNPYFSPVLNSQGSIEKAKAAKYIINTLSNDPECQIPSNGISNNLNKSFYQLACLCHLKRWAYDNPIFSVSQVFQIDDSISSMFVSTVNKIITFGSFLPSNIDSKGENKKEKNHKDIIELLVNFGNGFLCETITTALLAGYALSFGKDNVSYLFSHLGIREPYYLYLELSIDYCRDELLQKIATTMVWRQNRRI